MGRVIRHSSLLTVKYKGDGMNRRCVIPEKAWSTGVKWVALTLLSIALTACASQSTNKRVFWPAPPDLPRVQFLKSIKDSSDVMESKTLSLLALNSSNGDDFIPVVKPYGIAAGHGKIYICDTVQAEVLIIDLPKKKMTRLPGNINAGRLKKPVNVAVDEQGNIYVADTSRLEVLQYDPEGSFLRSFGSGKDLKPVAVAVEGDFVYLLDQSSSQIHIFDRTSGDYQKSIGRDEDPRRGLSGPTNMAVDGKGALYVSNFGTGKIIKLDRDGNFLMGYGRLGVNFGEFGRPRGVAVDNDGLVYVVDAAAQQVQIFDAQMQLLMFFGAPGTPGSLNIPAGIAVTGDNLDYYQKMAAPGFILDKVLFVVSQVGDHMISIYGLGKKQGLDYDAEYKKALADQEKRAAEALEKARKAQEEKEKTPEQPADAGSSDSAPPVK
ncbi:hypothetical protein ET418_11810 [Oryzomonas rubra]|uniref:NHL repeat-containing protein n=2 Tax=Oryzomonas rubra TaxID=2509454 RepID=A0A5A9XDB5_9BACT|nr:hypothetical protein ET418_11810 [Oryzomonas rubra]